MTLVMFTSNINSFKIVFVKDTFEREKCFRETIFTFKSVFHKDDFWTSPYFK